MGTDWSKVAEDYAAHQDEARDGVWGDIVRRINGQGSVKRILDLGCGSAFYLEKYAEPLPGIKIGYDPASSMVRLAEKTCAERDDVTIVASRDDLKPGSFDAVISVAVWMELPTENACVDYLRSCRELLAPGGQLYAVVTHPCFRDRRFKTFSTNFDMEKYFQNGTSFDVTLTTPGGEDVVSLKDTHWNLTAMFQQLSCAGLQVKDLCEYPDIDESSIGSPWLLWQAQALSETRPYIHPRARRHRPHTRPRKRNGPKWT